MIMYQYEEDMNKIYDLMRVHNDWMRDSVNLIASENTTSNAVTTAMASDLAHRYAEGQAYERLCQAKNRRPDKPIAVMAGKNFDLSKYFEISPNAKKVSGHLPPYVFHI